ncbi:MAG: GNAT family N-acetyltransferase [Alistipes sp.]|nr:GNAT family N-acetyltransferase [Alistipes sp.]
MMEIYDLARAFMRSRGNDVQWVGGYPSRELVAAGIEDGGQYVCVAHEDRSDGQTGRRSVCHDPDRRQNGYIAATFWFAVAPEPTYAEIFGDEGRRTPGAWLDGSADFDDAPYGVVHRLGSDGSVKGIGEFCLDWCLEKCGNIRVDTHAENGVMQSLMARMGYTRCGVIFVGDGTPRDVFQKRK